MKITAKRVLSSIGCLVVVSVWLFAMSVLASQGVAAPLEDVVLQLKWHHQFQFAGYYAAVEEGYYEDAGLRVTLLEGGPFNTAETVLSHRAHYGVSTAEILLQRLHGAPLVILAAIFQHSPHAFLVRQDTGIEHPQNLIGQRVWMTRETRSAELQATLINEGIALDRVEMVEDAAPLQEYLFDDTLAAIGIYVTNEPYYFEQQGIPVIFFQPRTYGIDFYGDCLYTSETELNDHPDRVRRFREASLKGWEYAMQHPEEIIELILTKYGTEKTRAHLRYEADKMRKLILPDLVELGHLNPGRWRHIADTYVQLGMAEPGYSLDGFLYNPHATPDYVWVYWTLGGGGLVVLLAVSTTLSLRFVNKRLQALVQERTQTLQQKCDELRESEERFRAVWETSADAMVLSDPEGMVLDANPAYLRLYGYAREDVVENNFAIIFPEEQRQWAMQQYRAVFAAPDTPPAFEATIQRSDDSTRMVESRIGFLVHDGQRYAMLSSIRDITERKRAEDALRESEQRFKAIIQHSPLGIGIVDSAGNLIGCNQALAELAGYTQEELLHLNFADFTHPDDLEREWELIQEMWDQKSDSYRLEKRYVHKDGSIIWVDVVAAVIKEDGTLKLGFAFVQNVTERKQMEEALRESEEKFRLLFNNSADAHVLYKADQFIDCNQATLDMLGFNDKHHLLARHPGDISPTYQPDGQGSREKAEVMIARTFEKGSHRFEWICQRADGSELLLDVLLNVIRVQGDALLHGVWRDITERKQAEDRLKASLAEKLVLLQELHHRVKNNMQSIQSLLRLQYSKLNDPADRAVFEDVEQRIHAMAIIHEMLYQADDFARIDFSRYLQALIAGIWSTYGSSARRITPHLETDQVLLGVDVAIACGMLVNELVVNSLKHAFPDEREGEVGVGLHKTGKTIALVVGDTGIGLPPETELHSSGTLGFTLVKGWIRQLQGSLEIDRSAGTCFRITFREPTYQKRGAH